MHKNWFIPNSNSEFQWIKNIKLKFGSFENMNYYFYYINSHSIENDLSFKKRNLITSNISYLQYMEIGTMLETKNAINLMLWDICKQIFIDGNKRTSIMIANKEMINHYCGIISMLYDKIKSFYGLLIKFYELNDIKIVLIV